MTNKPLSIYLEPHTIVRLCEEVEWVSVVVCVRVCVCVSVVVCVRVCVCELLYM